jgi:hypothetical protein
MPTTEPGTLGTNVSSTPLFGIAGCSFEISSGNFKYKKIKKPLAPLRLRGSKSLSSSAALTARCAQDAKHAKKDIMTAG